MSFGIPYRRNTCWNTLCQFHGARLTRKRNKPDTFLKKTVYYDKDGVTRGFGKVCDEVNSYVGPQCVRDWQRLKLPGKEMRAFGLGADRTGVYVLPYVGCQ
jgi:hypothetical protein